MEEILNTMRATQSKKNALGKARAMEMQMKSPQLMDPTLLEPTTDDVIHGKGGGGEAGIRRVIGTGKRGRPRKVAGTSNGYMEGGAMNDAHQMGAKIAEQLMQLHGKEFADKFHSGVMSKVGRGAPSGSDSDSDSDEKLRGGFWGVLASLAAPLIGKLFGNGQMTDYAHGELMNLFNQKKGGMRLLGMPGHGTFQGGAKKRGGAGPISAPPSGLQVSHAMMSPADVGLAGQALGGQDVPRNGIAPVAYGSPPQAPSSFRRNTVGMGRPAGAGMTGAAMKCGGAVSQKGREDDRLGMEVSNIKKKLSQVVSKGGNCCEGGAKKKSSARGQLISKIMKEKGMTLGQASKYIKENQ